MRRPDRPRGEWPLATSAAVALGGLVAVAFDGWRAGAAVFGIGVLLAAVLRLVLSDDGAGLLRVRRRPFDVVMLVVMAVAVLLLAVAVPDIPR